MILQNTKENLELLIEKIKSDGIGHFLISLFIINIMIIAILIMLTFPPNTPPSEIFSQVSFYNVWFESISNYFFGRFFNWIAYIVSIFSIILFFKVIITGKCPYIIQKIKGFTLGQLLLFNTEIALLCIFPFLIETSIFVLLFSFLGFILIDIMDNIFSRFDNACKETK